MSNIYLASVEAEGGGTDYVLVVAPSEPDAQDAWPNAYEIVELTPDWLESEYDGIAVLTTYEGCGDADNTPAVE